MKTPIFFGNSQPLPEIGRVQSALFELMAKGWRMKIFDLIENTVHREK